MVEMTGDKEVAWIQENVNRLSGALIQAVNAISDGEIELIEQDFDDYDEDELEDGIRIWHSPDKTKIGRTKTGKYWVRCVRWWKPSKYRGEDAEDILEVRVTASSGGRSPTIGMNVEILNRKVQEYHFGVVPWVHTRYKNYILHFDEKGKAVKVISSSDNEKLWTVTCKTIPQSSIPRFPKPTPR